MRFGNPNLGVGEPVVLERRPIEPHHGADLFSHLAHGAGEAPCSAIRDRVVQMSIAGGQHHVEHHLFGDRVADLHGAAGEAFALASQFGGAECGAVNAVAAGAPAQSHDMIAGLWLFEGKLLRQDAHVAAIDQRVAQVAAIEIHGAVDCGNAHAVAVVAHTGHDSLHDPAGMEHSGRQSVGRLIGRRETKHVGVADRLGAHAGAQGIANHATDASVRAAIGLEGRGMIVRFNFKADVVTIVEANHSGVVFEHAHAPITLAQLAANLLRGGKDGFFEHILKLPLATIIAISDPPGECLVAAMFAPGLRHGFQLDIRGLAPQRAKMRLDGAHFGQREIKLAAAAQFAQAGIVELA